MSTGGLGVWFREDIRHILLATRLGMLNSGGDGEYRRGFEAALVVVAQSIGIEQEGLNSRALLGKMMPRLPERTK